jgi:tetratricopeptide (TPR) repeat protein
MTQWCPICQQYGRGSIHSNGEYVCCSTGIPESQNPNMRKADRLQANGRHAEAIDLYSEVIRCDMYLRFEAYVAIAYCLDSLGHYRDAVTVCGYAESEYDGIERQGTLWTHSYLLHLKEMLRRRVGGGKSQAPNYYGNDAYTSDGQSDVEALVDKVSWDAWGSVDHSW